MRRMATIPNAPNHVGLNIMHERAGRIRAELKLTSKPGQTRIRLFLPEQERHPA